MVIVGVESAMVIVKLLVAVDVPFVTRSVNVNAPAAVGVPLIVAEAVFPDTAARVSPPGNAPSDTLHVQVPVQSDAMLVEYAVPIVPFGTVFVLMAMVGGVCSLMRIVRLLVADDVPFATLTVNVNVPVLDGVPATVADAEFPATAASVRPSGKAPAETLQVHVPVHVDATVAE
ncbi:MAG TPA: hypothetical protein VD837_09415 [Terriglobales bacterium]|nr:hypothetical protein [Terriglobales bacterium]